MTYLYEEADEALTPSLLAIGRSLLNKSINYDETTEYSQGLLCNRFRYLQSVIQHYWKRFSKEYLIQLHEHHIYTRCKKHDEVKQLLLNDVVLIRDDSLKRNMWRKRDGNIEMHEDRNENAAVEIVKDSNAVIHNGDGRKMVDKSAQ